mgnify:CR=1 FL=1
MKLKNLMLLAFSCSLAPLATAAVTFSVSYSTAADSGLTLAEKSMFNDALTFWDNIIIGYRDGSSRNWNLQVDTFSQAASGGVSATEQKWN